MGVLDVVQVAVVHRPEAQLPALAAAREHLLLVGVPLDGVDVVLVAGEFSDLFVHGSDVEELDQLVLGPGEQVNAVDWVPPHARHGRLMGLQLKEALAGVVARVPDAEGLIGAAGGDEGLEGVPVAGGDLGVVLLELGLLLGGHEVPHLGRPVSRAGGEFDGAHREGDLVDGRVRVSLELVLLHDLAVRINDVAVLVARHEELVVVGPLHGLHLLLMNVLALRLLEVHHVELDDLALARAHHHLLPVLRPPHQVQVQLVLVLAVAQLVRAHAAHHVLGGETLPARRLLRPVQVRVILVLGQQVLRVGGVGVDAGAVARVEVEVVVQLVVVDQLVGGVEGLLPRLGLLVPEEELVVPAAPLVLVEGLLDHLGVEVVAGVHAPLIY
uniref:Uncharacterized protein n=1 Tax=Strombidium rassoulzadegani TaxID=1082188 RepID=A0A7S3CM04_9SPIT|mmetsp:Transcript_16541/g.28115  ORF Transcript_16541/g.28115 Transcript_16541/m.28115 type:complete len:384 (+) Transcript_16541:174-1325(+)